MATVNVLIAVDALGAATSGNLQDNVYLVDTNKHIGSGNEGQAELYTVCHDGDIIQWGIASVDPGSDVVIHQFTGQIINEKICTPQLQPLTNAWAGRVEARGSTGDVQYACVVYIDRTPYTFDPFLRIQ